jgi:hypothetical protein
MQNLLLDRLATPRDAAGVALNATFLMHNHPGEINANKSEETFHGIESARRDRPAHG